MKKVALIQRHLFIIILISVYYRRFFKDSFQLS